MRISTADSIDGPFTVQKTFSDLPSDSDIGGSYSGKIAKNHCCVVPDIDLTFDGVPPSAQFFKFEVLQIHGEDGPGFYRVKFYGWEAA